MMLAIKSVRDNRLHNMLSSSIATIIIVLAIGLGIGAILAISIFIATTSFPTSESFREISIPITDLGSVNGFVISSSGLPTYGDSLLVYKHLGLTGLEDNNPG